MYIYQSITNIARELRKNQTPAEKKLWKELRNRKFNGYKFLRQHPIIYDRNTIPNGFMVVDFFCAKKKLIIEVDGKIHESQNLKDQYRDLTALSKGYHILRIKNEELKDIKLVLEKISQELEG